MAQLNTLPDDVLHDVFSFISTDDSYIVYPDYGVAVRTVSLYSLALTNRRLNVLASHYLYREIELRIQYTIPSFVRGRLKLFLRSLIQRPGLALSVHSLHLVFAGRDHLDNICDQANDLLPRLPALRTFWLEGFGYGVDFHYEPTFLDINPLSFLRTLTISDPCMTARDLSRYMALERIESIEVRKLYLDYAAPAKFFIPSTLSTSRPLMLYLEDFDIFIQGGVLRTSVALASRLGQLRYNVLGDENRAESISSDQKVTPVLSPAGVARVLWPTQDSLVKLKLDGCALMSWPSQDQSRMDMSQFSFLKSLTAPASCFFHAIRPAPSRDGFHKLLPPSLEELDISFECDWCFLYDVTIGDWQRLEANGFEVETDKYTWLREMATAKDRVSRLKRVSITEQTRETGLIYDTYKWDLPARLRAAFDAEGVSLQVTLRKPRGELPVRRSLRQSQRDERYLGAQLASVMPYI